MDVNEFIAKQGQITDYVKRIMVYLRKMDRGNTPLNVDARITSLDGIANLLAELEFTHLKSTGYANGTVGNPAKAAE